MESSHQFGPRIYNLFPRLLGSISQWSTHLSRILNMNFNWIYLNPINEAGFSGSLYSIANYFRLNSLFAVNEADQDSWTSFQAFVTACHQVGLRVMTDLVINHTAIDMVQNHPSWYVVKQAVIEKTSNKPVWFYALDKTPDLSKYPLERYEIRTQVANPYAINPENANELQIWGDLAEIDYDCLDREQILEFWQHYLNFMGNMGIDGFRADAAYQVSADVWKILIQYTKTKFPQTLFWAETLGATLPQYTALHDAGFDFIASSSKWWNFDFFSRWCITQYNEFRYIAPSISFPETHDTPRLAAESHGRQDYQVFRYFFAAFFSAGIMMPVGYEFGFQRACHVVNTTPNDWETPLFDISSNITQINAFKQRFQCLNEDGEITHLPYGDPNLLILRKRAISKHELVVVMYNKDWHQTHRLYIENLRWCLDLPGPIYQFDLSGKTTGISEMFIDIWLLPNEFLVFWQKIEL